MLATLECVAARSRAGSYRLDSAGPPGKLNRHHGLAGDRDLYRPPVEHGSIWCWFSGSSDLAELVGCTHEVCSSGECYGTRGFRTTLAHESQTCGSLDQIVDLAAGAPQLITRVGREGFGIGCGSRNDAAPAGQGRVAPESWT